MIVIELILSTRRSAIELTNLTLNCLSSVAAYCGLPAKRRRRTEMPLSPGALLALSNVGQLSFSRGSHGVSSNSSFACSFAISPVRMSCGQIT
jgi:hypothetical protein